VRRRIELDPRYANRQTFTSERGMHYRIVGDLERGARSNYDSSTIAAAEVAYGLEAGAIAAALDGGDFAPTGPGPAIDRSRPTGPLAVVPDAADEDAVIRLLIANERDPDRQAALRQTWEFTALKREDRLVMLRALLERGLPGDREERGQDTGCLARP
jgi:hypothetical protein